MPDFEVLYLPEKFEADPTHYCLDHLPDANDYPLDSVLACGKCGQMWFCDYNTFEFVWARVRWYHRSLRKKVKSYERQ